MSPLLKVSTLLNENKQAKVLLAEKKLLLKQLLADKETMKKANIQRLKLIKRQNRD